MATAELMDGSNSHQQPPTIPSSQRAPNHAWEGREGGREEGGELCLAVATAVAASSAAAWDELAPRNSSVRLEEI